MKIELYYFEDCPSWTQARDNLRDALDQEGLTVRPDLVAVADAADARTKRFLGSPTIRINGRDLEGRPDDAEAYAFGCRIYRTDEGTSGWPTVSQIRQALKERQSDTRKELK